MRLALAPRFGVLAVAALLLGAPQQASAAGRAWESSNGYNAFAGGSQRVVRRVKGGVERVRKLRQSGGVVHSDGFSGAAQYLRTTQKTVVTKAGAGGIKYQTVDQVKQLQGAQRGWLGIKLRTDAKRITHSEHVIFPDGRREMVQSSTTFEDGTARGGEANRESWRSSVDRIGRVADWARRWMP
jgi:hypothetical protein